MVFIVLILGSEEMREPQWTHQKHWTAWKGGGQEAGAEEGVQRPWCPCEKAENLCYLV
jgi:hypothetical protein